MKLEDQVCSLELSKRLKELGVKQESLFWYTCFNDGTADIHFQYDRKYIPPAHYSAFTIAELGEMLPDCINGEILFNNKNTTLIDLHGHFIKSSKKDKEYKIYIDGLTKCTIFFSENEAIARAKMLIYLLENKLMELP